MFKIKRINQQNNEELIELIYKQKLIKELQMRKNMNDMFMQVNAF
jgi:hypothetical protein